MRRIVQGHCSVDTTRILLESATTSTCSSFSFLPSTLNVHCPVTATPSKHFTFTSFNAPSNTRRCPFHKDGPDEKFSHHTTNVFGSVSESHFDTTTAMPFAL